jgi:hypothetical protein
MWQNVAFFLIGISILSLIGWGTWGFFTADEIPLLIRIAVGAAGTGVLILIGVAIKERVCRVKSEDYREVEY